MKESKLSKEAQRLLPKISVLDYEPDQELLQAALGNAKDIETLQSALPAIDWGKKHVRKENE